MRPQSGRRLDGFLAIGPHSLDAQLDALAAYALRTGHTLDVFWTILPDEDPATSAPDSGIPIVAFDDDIAGFTTAEFLGDSVGDGTAGNEHRDWHVAHPLPQPKRRTRHLPVYGFPERGETAADAILCIGLEPLDLQLARIEAYALRSSVRLQGVYVANDPESRDLLLRDFNASNQSVSVQPTLLVGDRSIVEVHL